MSEILYLYMFEDGEVSQSDDSPTEVDEISMDDGILDVIVVVDGVAKYFLNGNKIQSATVSNDGDGDYHQPGS